MNEHLIVKSFGPIRDLDITFKKVTLFIGDQGTGKSCVAKLFSMFKWLEKDLVMKRHTVSYYLRYGISKLLEYHGIDTFIHNDTWIYYNSPVLTLQLKSNSFDKLDIHEQNISIYLLPKIMYVPAERMILSVAENKSKLLKELPESCATFNEEFLEAKQYFKEGYDLPFDNLHFKFDTLNFVSKIWGDGYEDSPVLLRNSSSGIQSALPLCIVSEFMTKRIQKGENVSLSEKEYNKLSKEIEDIQHNREYSETVKRFMLKNISLRTQYRSFINIVEEPELNLFPQSQFNVLCSLIKDTADYNQLVLTTHSPYSLATLNTLILAATVYEKAGNDDKAEIEKIIPSYYHLAGEDIAAFRLSLKDNMYCESIINENTEMIFKNDLDACSDEISRKFNQLYSLYAKIIKR